MERERERARERERGIIHWLKRLKSSRRLEFLRLPGAPEEGQTFTGKEKKEEKKNQQPSRERPGPQ